VSLAATVAAAVAIGLLLGLLGGGGSILTVPVLVYLAGRQPQQAIAASLFVVAVTSAVALIPHARAGRMQWRTGLVFGTAGLAGAYTGGRLAAYLPAAVLLVGFGLLMGAAAIIMIRSCRRPLRAAPHSGNLSLLLGLGATVGLITGMVGAGGGFVIVPALVLLAGLDMATAVGTSLLVIALQASAGLAGHLQHTAIDWPSTLTITVLAIGGSLAGARLAGRLPPPLLRTGFGWFLATIAFFLLLQQAPTWLRHTLTYTAGGQIMLGIGCATLAIAAARHVHACHALTVSSRR
jgi:uncharacterized membrane protein YfcA